MSDNPTRSHYEDDDGVWRWADTRQPVAETSQRLLELARDPAHGGAISEKTIREAMIGLGLERRGDLPGPVRRSPNPSEELNDGNNQAWDIKGFHSGFPPAKGGFDLDDAVTSVKLELDIGENVIVDTAKMSHEHISQLKVALNDLGVADRVLWWVD